jgi:hypothetical protein
MIAFQTSVGIERPLEDVVAYVSDAGARSAAAETTATREGLHAVEERVRRGRTALGPLREAVAARAAVVGRDIDRARRAALDDLGLDASALQWAVVQPGRDGRLARLV